MTRTSLQAIGFAAGLAVAASNAHAYLGSFEAADGYQPFLNRVQEYNAGHYGPNSGYGGAYSLITPNTDFWKEITAATGGSYATGHQFEDRSWINNGIGSQNNNGLQLTTAALGFGGPALQVQYSIDQPDMGGVVPSSTGGSIVKMSFWWRGLLNGTDTGGQIPNGYLGNEIQLKDSSGNIGFKLGLTQRAGGDHVTYWNGSSMFESTIPATGYYFDRWDLTLDNANDTFSADYFQFSTSTLIPLAVNQPMFQNMNNLTTLDFRTSPGTFNDKQNGMVVDDFTFVVPEPATAGVLMLAAGALMMRRPSRG